MTSKKLRRISEILTETSSAQCGTDAGAEALTLANELRLSARHIERTLKLARDEAKRYERI